MEIITSIFRLAVGDGVPSFKNIRWPFWFDYRSWRSKEAVGFSQVCRLWRRLTLAERFLWNMISITDTPGPRQRDHDTFVNQRALSLPSTTPLDVYVELSETDLPATVFARIPARCGQLRTLVIQKGLLPADLGCFDSDAPLLENLHISTPRTGSTTYLPPIFNAHTPVLTHLMLSSCMFSPSSPLTTLTHLCLVAQHYTRFEHFLSIFRSNVSLRELRLEDCWTAPASIATTPLETICLPSLKQLSILDCDSCIATTLLQVMRLPSLDFALDIAALPNEPQEVGVLTMIPGAFWSQRPSQTFGILEIYIPSRYQMQLSAASDVSAIRVRLPWDTALASTGVLHGVRGVFPFAPLRTVCLGGGAWPSYGRWTVQDWQEIFKSMVSLTTLVLSFEESTIANEVWLAGLTPSLASHGDDRYPAPALHTLHLDVPEDISINRLRLLPVVASRASTGHRLHKLRIDCRSVMPLVTTRSTELTAQQGLVAWQGEKGQLEAHIDEVTVSASHNHPIVELPIQFSSDRDGMLWSTAWAQLTS